MATISTLSSRHVDELKSNLGKALTAIKASPLADAELYHLLVVLMSLRSLDEPSTCAQELTRAAQQLRLAVSKMPPEEVCILQFAGAAAAVAAYHWVWVVSLVAASHPTLISEQECEMAALAVQLLFHKLPQQLIRTWDQVLLRTDDLAGAAMLVTTAAAGAAAVGLLELQDWVREGLVPVTLPTDTPKMALLVEALALVASKVLWWEEDAARGTWVVEEGVLPLLYYAVHQPGQVNDVSDALRAYYDCPDCLPALTQYCGKALLGPAAAGLFKDRASDPWQAPQLEPLILALSLVAMWPGKSAAGVFEELERAIGRPEQLVAAAVQLLEKMWATAGKADERGERLAWAARAAAAAEALTMTCLRGQLNDGPALVKLSLQRGSGWLLASLHAGIAPAAQVALSAAEQLAAWAAPAPEEPAVPVQRSIWRYGLQQATLNQLVVLVSSLKYLHEIVDGLMAADFVGQEEEEEYRQHGISHSPWLRFVGEARAAPTLEALARLTGFLVQQGGFETLGLARAAEHLGLSRGVALDAALMMAAGSVEYVFWAALKTDLVQARMAAHLQGVEVLAQLPRPAELQALAHAVAARTSVFLLESSAGQGGLLDRRACAKSLAPSLTSAALLALRRRQLVDWCSEEQYLRDYSPIGWVLAPAAAALLRLAAKEGHGEGADRLVDVFSSLAWAGLGDMVARCGGGAVLHLGFEVPEHDVAQRSQTLTSLTIACKESPGMCVSLGRERFLHKMVTTAAAFGASRHGNAISRTQHLRDRLCLLWTVCHTVDQELGSDFSGRLVAVEGVRQCVVPEELSAQLFSTRRELSSQLKSRLKEQRLWDEVLEVTVKPLTNKCRELYEEACRQEETCVLRDWAVGRWAGVGCCNPGCCNAGGWGRERKLRKCTGCRVAKFCSLECLKQDWARHKAACKALAQRRRR